MIRTDDKIIDVTDDVKWIGVKDYDITTFDIVMTTEFGTTYNSYFINAEKKAIVEVAKAKFSETYFSKLRKLTDPAEISYIIVDHTEPDHVGSLGFLLKLAPEAIVVGSGNAIRYLADIVNFPFKSIVVKDGDTLDLGNKTLKFIAAPNLHWPDSIYTYLAEDKVLFTCDSFGAHFCSENMFSKFTDDYSGAFKYYFDVILRPFSKFMLKAIEKIRPLQIEYICPGHGPMHREEINPAIETSKKYSEDYIHLTDKCRKRNILICYVSAYGFTKKGAGIIESGIKEHDGIETDVIDIENIAPAVLESKIISSDAIIVGSPTINQNTLLPVYTLFALINPIRDRGKLAGAFGSFGWSGEASKIILENLKMLKLNVFEDNVPFRFSPESSEKKTGLKEYGKRFAAKFLEEAGTGK
ncbi:MAG TPA: FprA family A-type flavoprotein [Bacteroidales bacterium]|nr:FprA family A-type flavoprotein [Bacteroidales bacterium]